MVGRYGTNNSNNLAVITLSRPTLNSFSKVLMNTAHICRYSVMTLCATLVVSRKSHNTDVLVQENRTRDLFFILDP